MGEENRVTAQQKAEKLVKVDFMKKAHYMVG